MRKSIEVSLTPKEIAEIIVGIRPPITSMFKLEPEDGAPLAGMKYSLYEGSLSQITIFVEGEPRREE